MPHTLRCSFGASKPKHLNFECSGNGNSGCAAPAAPTVCDHAPSCAGPSRRRRPSAGRGREGADRQFTKSEGRAAAASSLRSDRYRTTAAMLYLAAVSSDSLRGHVREIPIARIRYCHLYRSRSEPPRHLLPAAVREQPYDQGRPRHSVLCFSPDPGSRASHFFRPARRHRRRWDHHSSPSEHSPAFGSLFSLSTFCCAIYPGRSGEASVLLETKSFGLRRVFFMFTCFELISLN